MLFAWATWVEIPSSWQCRSFNFQNAWRARPRHRRASLVASTPLSAALYPCWHPAMTPRLHPWPCILVDFSSHLDPALATSLPSQPLRSPLSLAFLDGKKKSREALKMEEGDGSGEPSPLLFPLSPIAPPHPQPPLIEKNKNNRGSPLRSPSSPVTLDGKKKRVEIGLSTPPSPASPNEKKKSHAIKDMETKKKVTRHW